MMDNHINEMAQDSIKMQKRLSEDYVKAIKEKLEDLQ